MLSAIINPGGKTKMVSTQGEDTLPLRFVLTEKEKFADDMAAVKRIDRFYESVGMFQTSRKDRETRKCYNLAYGKLDPRDYEAVEPQYAAATGVPEARLEDLSLDFYPIIPTFVRGVLGSFDKMYSEYTAQAVNPEATNDILTKRDNELRSVLLEQVEAVFAMDTQGDTAEVIQQKHDLVMKSEQVQKFYKSEYRSTVEEWSGHTMALEDSQFKMKAIERRLLEQEVVTGDPTLHIECRKGRYRPEILYEKDTFCLRAPGSRDYSESQMFGWFEYKTFSDVLNEYGSDLLPEDAEKISKWGSLQYGQDFVINGMNQPFSKAQSIAESAQNVRAVESVMRQHWQQGQFDTYGTSSDMLRVTKKYYYVPRKYGTLTFKSGQDILTETVDEQFKVTVKPVYEPGMKKSKDSLIAGEHVDWYWKPELWRSTKVSTHGYNPTGTMDVDDREVWIDLGRYEVQHSDPVTDNLYIPVHGGSVTNQYNDSTSPVKAAAPWQIMNNWVWNRNKQLLSTEIGKFYALPDSAIANESLDESWELHSLSKFVATARDTQVASLVGNALNPNAPTSFGSAVDMTNTADIIAKATFGQMLEAACYRSLGVTPEFLFGDISPRQSAKSAAMGQQRTSTQIQGLFTRVTEVMVMARTTMLASAKHIASKNPTVEMSYTTSQQGRMLFRTSTMEFPLYKVGVFAKSNGSDLAVIESMKEFFMNNNTIGADSYEMATLMTFKSIPQIMSDLKDIQDRKAAERQQEMQHQQEMQQQQIQAAQALQEREIQEKQAENSLDRDRDIMVAQIKTLGYADGTVADVQKEILDLQTANAQQAEMYARSEAAAKAQVIKERTAAQDFNHRQQQAALAQKVEMAKLQQKNRELDLREMDIKARNQRTKALD
jgi:hypothetical protein